MGDGNGRPDFPYLFNYRRQSVDVEGGARRSANKVGGMGGGDGFSSKKTDFYLSKNRIFIEEIHWRGDKTYPRPGCQVVIFKGHF